MKVKPNVLVLIGSSIHHYSSVRTLLDKGLNISSVIVHKDRDKTSKIKFFKKMAQKQGVLKLTLQGIERIVYKILNQRRDKVIYNKLFDSCDKEYVIEKMGDGLKFVADYNTPDVIDFIKSKKPDCIVIHTPYWVGKKIRDIVAGKIIGAHPGITQKYRGVHSPFWALYNRDRENIGYTVFWVDSGIDDGDIIVQGKVEQLDSDSYLTLSWRGMKDSYKAVANLLFETDMDSISAVKNESISDNTLYYHPTIFQYIRYRMLSGCR